MAKFKKTDQEHEHWNRELQHVLRNAAVCRESNGEHSLKRLI